MSKVLNGNAEGARQAEIGQLQKSLSVNEQVLRLQITMEHFVPMTFLYAIQQLVQVFLDKTYMLGMNYRHFLPLLEVHPKAPSMCPTTSSSLSQDTRRRVLVCGQYGAH